MSKFLSLEWFKNRVDHSIEKVIEKKLDKLVEEVDNDGSPQTKPYNSIKLVNDALTIVLSDDSIISKVNATEDDYHAAESATTIGELYTIVSDPNVVSEIAERERSEKRLKALRKGLLILEESGEFVLDGDSVYFKGISRSLPQLLVEELLDEIQRADALGIPLNDHDGYQSLKRFFMWCALNPRAEVAHELYRFLKENSFRITKQGFFVALRNVVTLHGSPELVHFISNTYNKVKAVWKKSPDDYTVFLQDGEYKLIHDDKLYNEETHTSTVCPDCDGEGGYHDDGDCYDDKDEEEWIECDTCDGTGEVEPYEYTTSVKVDHGEEIGKLTALYLDLPNRHENRFTDDWTRTFDIRIGKVVNMPQEDCNWSTQDCAAAGLHFTSDQIHYVGCGDQSVLVLINPMKVVGIGAHKGRCFEYLPIMTVPREEATEILHDNQFDTLQLDEVYAVRELDDLQAKVKEGFAKESNKYEFSLPNISSIDVRNIVGSLEEMKAEITARVRMVD
jgi:hypothetical protein